MSLTKEWVVNIDASCQICRQARFLQSQHTQCLGLGTFGEVSILNNNNKIGREKTFFSLLSFLNYLHVFVCCWHNSVCYFVTHAQKWHQLLFSSLTLFRCSNWSWSLYRPCSSGYKVCSYTRSLFLFFLSLLDYYCLVPMGFIPWEIRVAFSGESQLWQSCATQTAVHAWCLSVHNPLNSDTGSLSCAHTCHCTWECTGSIRESALKVDFLRKIPCHTGQSNLHRQRASPVLCQLSYIPNHHSLSPSFL